MYAELKILWNVITFLILLISRVFIAEAPKYL